MIRVGPGAPLESGTSAPRFTGATKSPGLRGQRVRLIFWGVKRPIRTEGLEGNWWLYEEAHLSSRARFALHVLFHRGEFEIEADELSIQRI